MSDKYEIYAREIANADYWVTVTSTQGNLKMFTNSPAHVAAFVLIHALRFLESSMGEEDDGEHLLPPTIQ